MLCRTECDEGGTLQESLTLAKVQQIDVVDQHNGSHGCNGGCDAWHSGSRTAIASLASLLLHEIGEQLDHWVVFLPFDFPFGLAAIFRLFFPFSRASTLACVLLSFAKALRLASLRGCVFLFALRLVFGLAFTFRRAFCRLLNPFAFRLCCPRGCHVFFELLTWELLRPPSERCLKAETTSAAFTSSCTRNAVVTHFLSQKMRRTVHTTVQATVQADVSRAPLWFLLRLFRFVAILSRFVHDVFHDTFASFLVQFFRKLVDHLI